MVSSRREAASFRHKKRGQVHGGVISVYFLLGYIGLEFLDTLICLLYFNNA